MKKLEVLLIVAMIFTASWAVLPQALADDPIIDWDFRESNDGHFTMTTSVYRIPEDMSDVDIYGIKIHLHAKAWPGCDSVMFWMKTSGNSHLIAPSTGFAGGGFSIGYGGGLTIGGSIPYAVVIDHGIGTNYVDIRVVALFDAGGYDGYAEFHVGEGEPFKWKVGVIASYWITFVKMWQDEAVWASGIEIGPPVASIMSNGLYEGTTALFDASGSRPGYDGDSLCPITQYTWDFGDGTMLTTTDPVVEHTYSQLGMYRVKLTVYAPGQGPGYDSYSTTETVVRCVEQVDVDAFVEIKNYDEEDPNELECRCVGGIGHIGVAYGCHAKRFYSCIDLVVSVMGDGEPLEGVEVEYSLIYPDGEEHDFGTHVTNASGIAWTGFCFYPPATEAGIYWFVATWDGHQDIVGFSYDYCLLASGYTFDGYNFIVEETYLVPEGEIFQVTANPPEGYQLRRWIINFFWVAYGNPIYIPVDYDYFVMAHFVPPVCAMKTQTDGYFYVPTVATDLLKIEMLFDDSGIEGDQTGGTSPYSTIQEYPDKTVDMADISFLIDNFMYAEGYDGWHYMADVNGDKVSDMADITIAYANYLNSGTYITDFSGVTVTFDTEDESTPDNGFVVIPEGAENFTVKQNGNPIGAMIIFW
jgi:PKD repeat protein